MQQDLLQGRRTEIDFLNGAVVRLGETFGIQCPVNQALATIIRQMESAARSATPPFESLRAPRAGRGEA